MTIDKPALTKLWQQAFGDPPEFIDGFFRTGLSVFGKRRQGCRGALLV